MMTLRRILCPVDFSEPSERALRYALAIARWHGAALTVLHVEDPLVTALRVQIERGTSSASPLQEDLNRFIADAGGSDEAHAAVITAGNPVAGVRDQAKRESSDLIVMGTRGRSELRRAVLGSVTDDVVGRSVCPVMTIPASAEIPATDGLMRVDPILCASDFSPACRKALELAISMGQEGDVRLILLHALPLPQVDASFAPLSLPIQSQIDFSEFRKDAFARLKRGLPSDAVFRCRPESLVVEGRPADAILDTAHKENVRLIVMGIQARGAVDRLLFGSTTRRIMQSATCPVLSIRADSAAEPWPMWPPAHEALAV